MLLEVAMNTTVAAAVGGITVFLCRLGTSKKYEAWQEKRTVPQTLTTNPTRTSALRLRVQACWLCAEDVG